MITVDLHTHTSHSHGQATVEEMFATAIDRGMEIFGFSEHSPRPLGYSYPKDYKEKLTAGFPRYVDEVRALADARQDGRTVLLGLEMDWLPGQEPFTAETIARYPFDYIIGGIHFLGTWGFDCTVDDWKALSPEQTNDTFERYFDSLRRMAASGMFHVAAHPDIIKIFAVDAFHEWLDRPESRRRVHDALATLRAAGMAMEISSAGLRKLCKEIYPCPAIMEMARELELPVTFGSDAHCTSTVAWGFDQLAEYARGFGYTHSVWFRKGVMQQRPF